MFPYSRSVKKEKRVQEVIKIAVVGTEIAGVEIVIVVVIGVTGEEGVVMMTIRIWFPSELAGEEMIALPRMIIIQEVIAGMIDPQEMIEDVTIINHQGMIAERTIIVMTTTGLSIKDTMMTMMEMIESRPRNRTAIVMMTMMIGIESKKSHISHVDPEVMTMMTEDRSKKRKKIGLGQDPAPGPDAVTDPGQRSGIALKIDQGAAIDPEMRQK